MEYKILIVGTVPYNEKTTSRAFASYFSGMKKECLAQVFSNTKAPIKGHCGTLYQITDQRMLQRHFNRNIVTGHIFQYQELEDVWENDDLEVGSSVVSKLYGLGKNKNSIIYLLRKFIWEKKYWCTSMFEEWLDAFNPDCVFLSFSDDFFILQIALFVAERFNIPIVSSIGDDYYFNYKRTIIPFYHIYKLTYRALVRKVFSHGGSAIYIGDKIRDKYNGEFGLNGETVYLTSTIKRRMFKQINQNDPIVSYFGNIRLGRADSLIEIANALCNINKNYKLHIYSNEQDAAYYQKLMSVKNIVFHGSISYEQVQKETMNSDMLIVVEGFRKNDIDITRYSLSTKVADALASGVAVLAYGSSECGAIEYAKSTGCIATCTRKDELEPMLTRLLGDIDFQKRIYQDAIRVTNENHLLQKSTDVFRNVVNKACEDYRNEQ